MCQFPAFLSGRWPTFLCPSYSKRHAKKKKTNGVALRFSVFKVSRGFFAANCQEVLGTKGIHGKEKTDRPAKDGSGPVCATLYKRGIV